MNSYLRHLKNNYIIAASDKPPVASKLGAGLVVIGSAGRKGVRAKLMGNTTEGVLALLKTDILVVQP